MTKKVKNYLKSYIFAIKIREMEGALSSQDEETIQHIDENPVQLERVKLMDKIQVSFKSMF